MNYTEFLTSKKFIAPESGFIVDSLNEKLFPFQKDIVKWGLKKGKAAIFADCGMGKTPMQLEWAHQVNLYTGGDILILAPLAVSKQTKREGEKFGIEVNICRAQKDVKPGINIANYEMLDHFNPSAFIGVVLDESSILKSYSGKFRNEIIDKFRYTQYKLACTATPAPNDFMELGNHAEFLSVMTRPEMLSTFFIHDGGDTSKWRLKGHAETEFWKWMASWAVMIRKPSDLGYDDGNFILPEIKYNIHHVEFGEPIEGQLFKTAAQTLQERQDARRSSIKERVNYISEVINKSDEPWIVWCNLNEESKQLKDSIKGAIEIKGSDTPQFKENSMLDFASGSIQKLVTKPLIAGFGMNWQHCNNMAFVGLSDSYEQFYQAVRRCWRFGQTQPVNVHIVIADIEGNVLENIMRKEQDAVRMAEEMTVHMKELTKIELKGGLMKSDYKTEIASKDHYTLYLGDSVELVNELKDNSIGLSVFSPPFAQLYTYSNSDRDMGNSKNYDEFFIHFKFLAERLFNKTMPGRHVVMHCQDIPAMKERDGYIGLKDFPADLRRLFENAGFIYHSKVTIWKDPVVEMQRTKALGLLHKQIRKDSSMSRVGLPDYLIVMRKPGVNPEPIEHDHQNFPVDKWQEYASPVWMDINQSSTLQRQSAREDKDEKHICPLQLDVIERAIELWSKPGDLVFSPFMGIGSEGFMAIKMKRKFTGIELKESYFRQAVKNIELADEQANLDNLFSNAI